MNRYADIGREMLADDERAKASTIQFGAQTTPDQEAETLSLAKRTGAPADAVRVDLEGARLEAQRQEMAALSPTTQKWLTENPNRYALVKDDLGTLDKLGLAISRTFQSAKDFGLSSTWHTWSNQMAAWDEMGREGEAMHMPTRQPMYVEEFWSSLFAGYQRALGNVALAGLPDLRSDETRARAESVARGLGFESDEAYQASRAAQFAASQERRAQQIERVSEATDAQFQNIAAANEADSLWEALGLVARSPRAAGVVIGQSLGMGAPGLALTAATGGMGRLATMTAAGGSSGWVEYGASISEALAESGVDMTDPAALARALRNPELVAEARSRAAKRGIAIGAFDAATAGLAGQLLINARRGAVSAASRAAGEMGIQAAGGSLGELTAGLVAGDGVNYGDIILEGLAEVPFGAVEARANYVSARERGQVRWINEQLDIVRRSGEGSDALSAATIAAGNAYLSQRSPEEAQAFAAASGAEGGVYLDADVARVLFQDNWQTLVDVVGGDTALTEQLASGDVVIPADQYFGVVAGLPNAQEIARNARTQSEALSAVELEQYDFDALADEMAGDAIARSEPGAEPSARQRIQEDVFGQLVSTGRYSDSSSEQQAKLFAAGITQLANMWGVDPWALYEQRMGGIRSAAGPGQVDPRSTPPWAGTGRLDALLDAMRSPDSASPQSLFGPSITQFIVGRGGVTDVGGDLRSMDAGRQRIGLINQRGEDLDRAREAAAEAGYLSMDSTVADLLDLIDRDLRGDGVFSPAMGDRARQDFQAELDQLSDAITENEQLRDMPADEFNALTNQQIAEILFGRSFEQQRQALNFDQDAATDFDPAAYRPEVMAWAQERFGDLVAPNGRPVWQNFTAWFGDSQVVDAEGRPLVTYHSTTFGDFDTFNRGEQRKGMAGFGFYFSDQDGANIYADYGMNFQADQDWRGNPKRVNVIPSFLAASNPLVVDNISDVSERYGRRDPGAFGVGREYAGLTDDALTAIERDGYDGVITNEHVKRQRDGSYKVVDPDTKGAIKHPVYVVFQPEQIKSATGNRGNFAGDQPGILDQSAYHGTPHDVDRFSLQRIGTGEGRAAYGWGLYFASQQDVADFYRRNLAGIARNVPATMADDALRAAGGDRGRAVASMVRRRDALPEAARGNTQAAIDWLRRGQDHGRLYQVDIPEDGDLLNWDAPLSEQPEHVQQALAEMDPDMYSPEGADYDAAESGSMIYTRLANQMGPQAASEALLAAGVPGLLYLDGDSRDASGGTNNYVIWDEAAVSEPVRLFQSEFQTTAPTFETGRVVSFVGMRNPEFSRDDADPGSFGMDIEPVGVYMVASETGSVPEGWTALDVTLRNPLVVESENWKESLSEQYGGATGQALTDALVAAGHDGIVTQDQYGVGEVVVLDEASINGPANQVQDSAASVGDSLVAIHNLSAENLLFSDRLGGLPAPSIGITKAASPFRGFGSISLIGGRALATPDATNPVFSADAYTQRFPEVFWPKVKSAKADKFLDGIGAFDSRDTGQVWDYLVNNPHRERAIETAVRSTSFMKAWLNAVGETPVADVTKGAKPRQEWMDDAELLAVVDEVRGEVYARDLPPDDPRAIRIGEAARGAIERYVRGLDRDQEGSDYLIQAYMDRSFEETGALSYSTQDGVITFAERRNRPPELDNYATGRALSEQIGQRQPEFEAWVTEQISGLFDEPKIQLGRKKVPMTLENVVEAMTRQRQVAGREQTATFSTGQVAARNARRYRTLEEIQADRDLIVSPDEQTEANEGMESKLAEFRNSATEYFTGTNHRGEIDTWEALDMSMKSLADASKKAATASNVAAALRRNGFDGFPDSVAQAGAEALSEIRSAVTDYFEAKPQRAVNLSEFSGAVIPSDASPEVREVLDKHGIRWMEYGEDVGLTQEQAVSQLSAEVDGGTGDVLFQPEGGAPAAPQAPRGQIEIFPDRRMAISLFEGADRSTFLHETGHFFLEVLRDIAADPNAPEQARNEMAVLLDWFGVESMDQIGREQHEQFARGFEKYLAEGKAPSPELQSAFSAFKAWLKSVYVNLLNLKVELTDDVRGVMDRLLASDAEIEAAHIRQGMEPMNFGDGVLEEAQIREYAEQLAQATESERAAVEARLIAAHDRAAKRWYRDQKAEVRKEVEAEYAAMPVYRAARVLAGAKKYADGTAIPAELQGIKLDKASLVAIYGEDYLQRIKGMYRVKGGIDQDLAAMRLGFESGDALVTALANREDMDARVQAETDERMRERHGDPMTDGTLAERAMDAVHGDHRMRVLAWELSVLEALAADPTAVVDQPRPTREQQAEAPVSTQEGQEAPQRRQISPETRERIRQAQARRTAATRALAEVARRSIGNKTLRDIRPHDFLAAERKAARKATAAAAAGRYVEGLQAKRQQVFNAAMYREAMRVQKRADANVRFLRKAASDQTRSRVGKQAGKFYVDALDAIFDGIEVRGVSRPQVARRAGLREWVARMQEAGNSTAVPEALLARVESENVTNLADMTVADVEGMREAVENILHLARTKNRLQTAKGEREWDEVKAEMVERLEEQPDRHGRYGISDADRALFDRIKDLYAAGSNWVLQPETMVEWLDGGDSGPFHDLLWNMAQAAERKREALNRQVGNALQEALADLPAADRKALDRRFHIESLGGDVSGHSILSALLNMGNEGNRDKLVRGGRVVGDEIVPFTEPQIADMFSKLTRPQAEAVQKIWDAIDQLWPEIVALEESMNGIAPEKVEASQFTVMTRDGPVSLRGGYYPVMYDPKGARVGQFSEDEQAKRVLSGQTPIRASTSKGHVEKRTDFAAPLLLDYHSVITRHLDGVIGDISYRQFLRQVYKVLGDPDIRRMIDNRVGPGAATGLRQSFERGAVGHFSLAGPLLGPFQKVADAGMTNLSSAALGFRIPLAMANVVAVPIQAGARVKPRFVLRGLRDYYLSGGPNIIGNMRRNAEMVQRLSPLMLRRSEARSVELSSIIANLRGKRGFRAKMIEMAMAMHQWTVPLAENAVWMGAYQQAQDGGATMQDAIVAADKAIRQTQTKTSAAELSRGEGGPMRMFMQFAGPLVIMNNRMQEAGLRGLRGDVKSWPQALGVWFAVAMGAAWSFELMMGRGPEGDDGEEPDVGDWIAWAALKLALLPFAAFPLIRDVAGFADSGFSRGTPLVEAGISLYEATIGTAEELFSEDEVNVEKIIKSQVRASGAAVGVPSNQLLRTGDYLMSVGTGEHELGNPAAEAYYLVQGAPDEE